MYIVQCKIRILCNVYIGCCTHNSFSTVGILSFSYRWKVTSKEALAQISEYSEAGITVRGKGASLAC